MKRVAAAAVIGLLFGCLGFGSFQPPVEQDPIDLSDLALPEDAVVGDSRDFGFATRTSIDFGETRLWVYRPAGEHAPGSLPVVFIAPAGSTLLEGMGLSEGDTPEHLPYAEAGMVVVAYELDGHEGTDRDHIAFAASQGGLENALHAVRFVERHVPEVDRDRMFAGGHSSAGDAALLLGAHEPALVGVVAFNTAGEGCWFQPEALLVRMAFGDPGFAPFCQRTRAASHLGHFEPALFLFGSPEDQLVSIDAVAALGEQAKRAGIETSVVHARAGDHYASMLEEGIPAALEWMKARSEHYPP